MSKYEMTDEYELLCELPICGCGRPEYSYEMFRKWLQYRKEVNDFNSKFKLFDWHFNESIKFRSENELCQYFDKIFDNENPNEELEGAYAIINGTLDNLECTEHGSSWYNSWLTEKGKKMLAALNLAKENNYDFSPEANWCYKEVEDNE